MPCFPVDTRVNNEEPARSAHFKSEKSWKWKKIPRDGRKVASKSTVFAFATVHLIREPQHYRKQNTRTGNMMYCRFQ